MVHPASQLSQVDILGGELPSQSRVPPNGSPVEAPPVGPTCNTVQESMDMLATTVSTMAHIQDMSGQGEINDNNNIHILNPISRSSPTLPAPGVGLPMRSAPADVPVMVTHLRDSQDLQRRAAEQQARLQHASEQDTIKGEHFV